MPAKGVDSALVHLFPKQLFDQITAASRQVNGRLVRLLPTTTILANQLKELPIEKEELVLLAAETGPSTTIVIGRRDGRVCLSRILRGGWSTQADRVAVDISRTIGFAEQQTGLTVNSVWLFGPNVDARLAQIQTTLRLPVKPSPVEYSRFTGVCRPAGCRCEKTATWSAWLSRKRPQRWRRFGVAGAALLLMMAGAGGFAWYANRLCAIDQRMIVTLDAEIARWTRTKADWLARHAEEARKRDLVKIVSGEQPLTVPTWFLGYLGDATPPDLLLTRLEIKRTNDTWNVRVSGTAQPTTNENPHAVFQQAVSELTNNLSSGPFHLTFTPPPEEKAPGVGRAGTPAIAPPTLNFSLEGLIR
jgi:hypothetical protein